MNGFMMWAHLWVCLCGFAVSGFLLTAARSPEFRFLIGPTERDRSYNFGIVSLFILSLGLDMLAAVFGADNYAHRAAVALACLTGTIAACKFSRRAIVWKT